MRPNSTVFLVSARPPRASRTRSMPRARPSPRLRRRRWRRGSTTRTIRRGSAATGSWA
jgi:hypothetical protein